MGKGRAALRGPGIDDPGRNAAGTAVGNFGRRRARSGTSAAAGRAAGTTERERR
jgi:hypothetical protein